MLFIQVIDAELEVTLHGTTTGENIFKEIAKVLIQYNLKWNLLRCVITDDKNMCGAED